MLRARDRARQVEGSVQRKWGESQRQLRVAEELRHALAKIFQEGECRDPALRDTSIAVTEVRMSPDLRNATAFVVPLGGENTPEIIAGLKRSSAFLRRLVAREVPLRYAPRLVFALDGAFAQADRIAALLARPEVARDLGRPGERTEKDGDAH
ncbi:MAG: 30S ribosome-binding factor RbfA [Alphaproteobacteria bacterium]|nr:MAG: 30S ribosome-binding factor RbfA [Alphaproteobacteria bacterium]